MMSLDMRGPGRRGRGRGLVVFPAALLAMWFLPGAPASPAPANPWLGGRPLVIAHQGGTHEAPSSTLFAFKSAMAHGADVLEMDVHETGDGHLVVIHDDTVARTTGTPGFVRDLTLDQLKALDAGYCWHPGTGDGCDERVTGGDYPMRGVATGAKAPPAGFGAGDFRIPTLQEVLGAVRGVEQKQGRTVRLEIEIKYNPLATAHPVAPPFEDKVADVLASPAYARDAADTAVASTLDDAIERFRAAATLRGVTFSMVSPAGALLVFLTSSLGPLPGAPNPLYQILAAPRRHPDLGVTFIDDGGDFVRDAHANGFAVHAWTIDDPAEMVQLLAMGVDGIITDRPSELRRIIDGR